MINVRSQKKSMILMIMVVHDNSVDGIDNGNNENNVDHLMMIIIIKLQFILLICYFICHCDIDICIYAIQTHTCVANIHAHCV